MGRWPLGARRGAMGACASGTRAEVHGAAAGASHAPASGVLCRGLIVMLLIAAPACDPDGPVVPAQDVERIRPARSEVERIVDHPDRYTGQTVTIRGRVARLYGLQAFAVDGGSPWGDDTIVVAARGPIRIGGIALRLDDEVIVTGVVRRGPLATLERTHGWDLPAELDIDAPTEPVLEATEVRRTGEAASWTDLPPTS